MTGLVFDHPGRLWLLLVVVALGAAYVLAQRRRSRYAVRLTGLDLLASVAPRLGWRRHVGAALVLTALAGSTAAFADPSAEVQVPRERATVVVALDVSLSMAATDVAPDRFTAAQAAAQSFVDGLPARFNVGLVAFSGSAAVIVPATQEHLAVERAIAQLRLGNGTAVGEAVAASLSAVDAVPGGGDPVPAHIVLLSDGANTAGRSIDAAAALATAAHVPVSTIAYGTQQGTVTVDQRTLRVPVDATALAQLAAGTDGSAYEAADGEQLTAVYADIGSSLGTTTERQPVGAPAAGLALLATVGAAAAAVAWAPRAL